jgi:hypothetical protein
LTTSNITRWPFRFNVLSLKLTMPRSGCHSDGRGSSTSDAGRYGNLGKETVTDPVQFKETLWWEKMA